MAHQLLTDSYSIAKRLNDDDQYLTGCWCRCCWWYRCLRDDRSFRMFASSLIPSTSIWVNTKGGVSNRSTTVSTKDSKILRKIRIHRYLRIRRCLKIFTWGKSPVEVVTVGNWPHTAEIIGPIPTPCLLLLLLLLRKNTHSFCGWRARGKDPREVGWVDRRVVVGDILDVRMDWRQWC